jgi:hypothetical protein
MRGGAPLPATPRDRQIAQRQAAANAQAQRVQDFYRASGDAELFNPVDFYNERLRGDVDRVMASNRSNYSPMPGIVRRGSSVNVVGQPTALGSTLPQSIPAGNLAYAGARGAVAPSTAEDDFVRVQGPDGRVRVIGAKALEADRILGEDRPRYFGAGRAAIEGKIGAAGGDVETFQARNAALAERRERARSMRQARAPYLAAGMSPGQIVFNEAGQVDELATRAAMDPTGRTAMFNAMMGERTAAREATDRLARKRMKLDRDRLRAEDRLAKIASRKTKMEIEGMKADLEARADLRPLEKRKAELQLEQLERDPVQEQVAQSRQGLQAMESEDWKINSRAMNAAGEEAWDAAGIDADEATLRLQREYPNMETWFAGTRPLWHAYYGSGKHLDAADRDFIVTTLEIQAARGSERAKQQLASLKYEYGDDLRNPNPSQLWSTINTLTGGRPQR